MVAPDVVHDELSGAPAKSTQIRTAQRYRAHMAASLAMFFFSITPYCSRSLIEPFTLQNHGSGMSSSLNDKYFFFWIFFTPCFLAITFSFEPVPP
jgi:hypothetical protein